MKLKSGSKTTEFWTTVLVAVLSVVGPALVNIFGSEDAFPQWAKVASVLVGAALAVLASLGYTKSRTAVKSEEIKAKATEAKAEVA